MRRAALTLIALSLLACEGESYRQPDDACRRLGPHLVVSGDGRLDLLFVIDDTGRMAERQSAFAAALPHLVGVLTSGDRNEDGDLDDAVDFEPLRDIQVGVVTTDMGTRGHALPTCAAPDLGDDGILHVSGPPACDTVLPAILRDPRGVPVSSAQFADAVACSVAVGTSGCGVPQPLEAALKALSPSVATPWTAERYVAPRFFRDSPPHGDRENDGFVREDSALAIVLLTSHDDCSIRDAELFAPTGPYASTPLGLRCALHEEALHDVERFVEGLLQLRATPDRLVFAPIAGVPVELAPGEAHYDALVSSDLAVRDDRMEVRVDGETLVPSCEPPASTAAPPLRLVRLAQALDARGAGVTVQSVCGEMLDAVDALVDPIVEAAWARCVRPIVRDASGASTCTLVAELPAGSSCGELVTGATELGATEDAIACAIPELVPSDAERASGAAPAGTGWFVDDYRADAIRRCPEGARVGLTFRTPIGIPMHLECDVPSDLGLGTPCAPEADACAWSGRGIDFACDPITSRCGVRCDEDRECEDAGLYDHVCDTRSLETILPSRFSGRAERYGFCAPARCDGT